MPYTTTDLPLTDPALLEAYLVEHGEFPTLARVCQAFEEFLSMELNPDTYGCIEELGSGLALTALIWLEECSLRVGDMLLDLLTAADHDGLSLRDITLAVAHALALLLAHANAQDARPSDV